MKCTGCKRNWVLGSQGTGVSGNWEQLLVRASWWFPFKNSDLVLPRIQILGDLLVFKFDTILKRNIAGDKATMCVGKTETQAARVWPLLWQHASFRRLVTVFQRPWALGAATFESAFLFCHIIVLELDTSYYCLQDLLSWAVTQEIANEALWWWLSDININGLSLLWNWLPSFCFISCQCRQ